MIVVTGATGNVGRPLVRALAAAGERVTTRVAGEALNAGWLPPDALGGRPVLLVEIHRITVDGRFTSGGNAVEDRAAQPVRRDALVAAELGELLPAAEAMVVPSTFPESFGMVAAEAAACGTLPVVARHSGLAEVAAALARTAPPEVWTVGVVVVTPRTLTPGVRRPRARAQDPAPVPPRSSRSRLPRSPSPDAGPVPASGHELRPGGTGRTP